MSQHDFVIDNAPGLTVRTDLNNALQALVSLSAGTSAPTTTYAYQPWYDTTNGLLKFRNAANSAWVTFGPVADSTRAELYVSGTKRFDIDTSGNATFTSTGGATLPKGTTAQRPTAVQGQIRFNTTLSQFEGYDGTAWGSIGGAGNGKLDTFSGNGSTTAFTLTADPGNKNNTIVTISGVVQHKATYSISGTTLTFTTAPPSGTNNIEVQYNVALSIGTPADATVTAAKMNSGAATSGQVPVANGSGGVSYQTISPGALTSGFAQNRYYYGMSGIDNPGAAVAINRLYGHYFVVTESATFTRIGIKVNTLSAGNARLGIYNVAGGVPTSLILDAGTVNTGTTGEKEITISQTLTPGTYVTAAVFSATPTVAFDSTTAMSLDLFMGNTTSTSVDASIYSSFTYAALPTPFGTLTYSTSAGPMIWLRKV